MADGGEIGGEEHLAPSGAAEELDQLARPVGRRVRGRAEVDVGELQGHGHRFAHPGPSRVRQHERHVGEVDRRPVDTDRLPALAGQPSAGGTGLHHHGHAVPGAEGVERVVVGMVERPVEAVGVQVRRPPPRAARGPRRPAGPRPCPAGARSPTGPRSDPGTGGPGPPPPPSGPSPSRRRRRCRGGARRWPRG